MKQIMTFIFGERAQGTKLTPPSFRTMDISNRPSENQWYQELRVSSKYGTKGSFYQTR